MREGHPVSRVAFLALCLMLVGCQHVGGTVVSAPGPADTDLIGLTNQTRAEHGLPALARDVTLDHLAQIQANKMLEAGRLSHQDVALLFELEPGVWMMVGENVGFGGSFGQIHAAFMSSPAHAANVVRPYDSVGVGVVSDGGRWWVSMVYGQHA